MSWIGRQRLENIYFPNIDYERLSTPDVSNNLNPYSSYHYQNNNWLAYPSLYPEYLATFWQRYFSNLYNSSLGIAHEPYENGNSYYYYCPPNPERIPAEWAHGNQYRASYYSNYGPSISSAHRDEPETSIRKDPSSHSSDNNDECFGLPRSSSTPEKTPTTKSSVSSPHDDITNGYNAEPLVTIYGTISVYLRQQMRVDLTIDKAIRLVNYSKGTVVAMSSDGRNISLTHKNGKALLEHETVHFECNDISAKISNRGVVFTALKNSLIYLVDASGTKTTTERFRDMNRDISVDLFYTGSTHGSEVVDDCFSSLSRHFYRSYEHGDDVWTIAGVRIKQAADGDVRVSRDMGQLALRMSPSSGNISVSTDNAHMSASNNSERLLFVRQGDKRLQSHAEGFTVKHGTQKAGFDSAGQIILS